VEAKLRSSDEKLIWSYDETVVKAEEMIKELRAQVESKAVEVTYRE
jgi:hypothetical protein